jgi:phosphoenolpyruvate carboxykinase (GTP)
VVPGTSPKTNRNAYEMIHHDTIYTNVALTADNQPWWEGRPSGTPAIDWQGRPYDKANGPAAHPNSRFTVSAKQNPAYNHLMEHPDGVPISAILFGGRRREVAPLVYEARDWAHGVMVGAGMASETTAAAVGQVGVVRRDSMAMKPFCGYNFADYWTHWLSFEGRVKQLPRVFHVNWFRQDKNGKFLWPGFGDNLRVLSWVIDRCEGRAGAEETPIGFLPRKEDLDLRGLDLADGALHQLLDLDRHAWHHEIDDIGRYLEEFGDRTPPALREQYKRVKKALG